MERRYLEDEIVHLKEIFLPEDQQDYLERLQDVKDEDHFYSEEDLPDPVRELALLCEETFECDVVDKWCRKFKKGGETKTGRQDDSYLLIYSFGATREVLIESTIQDVDDHPIRYSLESGDILYLPPTEQPRVYTVTKVKGMMPTVMIFFHTTKPYSRDLRALSLFGDNSFFQTSFGSSAFPTSGVVSVSRNGNTTNRVIDGNSDYGQSIIKQVSASLAAQGIFLDWD